VYFVRDDGRVDTLKIPDDASLHNAERVGKEWILADSGVGAVQLFWSSGGGKEWTHKTWGIETSGGGVLALVDGKPTVSVTGGWRPTVLFPVGTTPANDPPEPVVIDPAATLATCDVHAATVRRQAYLRPEDRRLGARVDIGGKEEKVGSVKFVSNMMVTHSTASGVTCASAYVLASSSPAGQTMALYPQKRGWAGWWFKAGTSAGGAVKGTAATPVRCVAE
jgi:hypothetical protein